MAKSQKVRLEDEGVISLADLLEQLGMFTVERAALKVGKSEHTIKYHVRQARDGKGRGLLKGRYLQVSPNIKIWVCTGADLEAYAAQDTKSRQHLAKPKEEAAVHDT